MTESYEFRIDVVVFHAEVEDGAVRTGLGPAETPAVTFIAGDSTLQAIASGETSIEEALRSETLELKGAAAAVRRLFEIFPAAEARTGEPLADDRAS